VDPLQVVDHDELTPSEARAARLLLGPFSEWNPDMAMRYLPLVRLIRRHGLERDVTDVGSGSAGIAPYLRGRITGVDTSFLPKAHRLVDPVERSVLDTGFPARSRPCVISVDMLEHLPPAVREPAVRELVRIARDLLIVAAPAGRAAADQDARLCERFKRRRGATFRFLEEHLEHGLPSEAGLRAMVEEALAAEGRSGTVTSFGNSNLRVRELVTRRWIDRRLPDKVAWVALTWLSPLLARCNWGVTYRHVVVVQLAATASTTA
jgi:hypothetical protein